MARSVLGNRYKFSIVERFVESKIWKKIYHYPLPEIEMKRKGDFYEYDIVIEGEVYHFYLEPGGLQKYELQSCYMECFQDYRVNGHAYLRPEMKVHQGDIVVDAGGCEGFFARYALIKGAKRVIVLEPCVKLANGLERTFEKEIENGSVVLIKKGLGKRGGQRDLFINENMYCASSVNYIEQEHVKQEMVDIDTLDNVLSEIGADHIDLIKMDIEGAEMEALEGAKILIEKSRPRMMIATYHGYENSILCRERVLLIRNDYRVRMCGCYPEEMPKRPYMTLFY